MTEVLKNEKSVIINLLVLDLTAACQRRRCQRQGFDPWVRKVSWKRKWQPLQYSCLKNPLDRGDWRATVHRVAKSWTLLKWLRTHAISQLCSWWGRGNAIISNLYSGRDIFEGIKIEILKEFIPLFCILTRTWPDTQKSNLWWWRESWEWGVRIPGVSPISVTS